jgi:uncharacterized protein (DUF1697 family)
VGMRYAAFLRAVNLGRNRRVTSAQLRSLFEEVGAEDVATFRTSGNVVFSGEEAPEAALVERLEAGLAQGSGFDVRVILRTAAEVRAIAAREPFPAAEVERSSGKLQVSLLAAEPARAVRRQVLAMATERDRLALAGRELYWLPSGGLLESALDLAAIERLTGLSTRRTKGTLDLIAAKYFAD